MEEINDQATTRQTKTGLRYFLEELLVGVTLDEAHQTSAEIDWGPAVGQEIIPE